MVTNKPLTPSDIDRIERAVELSLVAKLILEGDGSR